MIKDFVNETFPGINKTFITNPDYETNNNSYSLWMTKDFVKEEILLLDSDILFDEKIIAKLLNPDMKIVWR